MKKLLIIAVTSIFTITGSIYLTGKAWSSYLISNEHDRSRNNNRSLEMYLRLHEENMHDCMIAKMKENLETGIILQKYYSEQLASISYFSSSQTKFPDTISHRKSHEVCM